jgi:nickel-type superoxide dismutase maturation protease
MPLLPFAFYRVSGSSMLPTLQPGDTLLGLRWFRPRVGHVVVIWHEPHLIKRIARLSEDQVWVEGDNANASTDSRHFGPLSRADLEARVVRNLR